MWSFILYSFENLKSMVTCGVFVLIQRLSKESMHIYCWQAWSATPTLTDWSFLSVLVMPKLCPLQCTATRTQLLLGNCGWPLQCKVSKISFRIIFFLATSFLLWGERNARSNLQTSLGKRFSCACKITSYFAHIFKNCQATIPTAIMVLWIVEELRARSMNVLYWWKSFLRHSGM